VQCSSMSCFAPELRRLTYGAFDLIDGRDDSIQPSYLRELFTNQAHEFLLANVTEDFEGVHGYRVALFGFRRAGKILLAQARVIRLLAQGDVPPSTSTWRRSVAHWNPLERYVGWHPLLDPARGRGSRQTLPHCGSSIGDGRSASIHGCSRDRQLDS